MFIKLDGLSSDPKIQVKKLYFTFIKLITITIESVQHPASQVSLHWSCDIDSLIYRKTTSYGSKHFTECINFNLLFI